MQIASQGTVAEAILMNHAIEHREGFVNARADVVMSHDATTSLIVDRLSDPAVDILDPSRLLLVSDHFCAPSTPEHAEILGIFYGFARRIPGAVLRRGEGICHQILAEDPRTVPGAFIVGADSHTVTAGALGCFATGGGSTDLFRLLVKGSTWFRVPDTIKVEFIGTPSDIISGRDIALHLLGLLGENGAIYAAIEFHDSCALSMDARLAICNCVVEAGAKCGIFVPDEITDAYLSERGALKFEYVRPEKTARYVCTITIDLDDLSPQVARPHSPADTVDASSLHGILVNRAFIGSCAAGRLCDLMDAAEILSDGSVHRNVELVVIPASRKIYREAIAEGIVDALVSAGAIIAPPSCGPCGGISNGLLGPGDVCISTSTRNYRGRMGDSSAAVYLASSRTVALSAMYGEIRS